jgi:hypothetical protein
MGPDRSVSRAAAALLALGALLSPELGRAESPEVEISKLQSELASTRSELSETKALLAALAQKVDSLARAEAAAPAQAGPPGQTARIAPVNADNPAISFVVDGKGIANTNSADGVGYALGTAELFLAAPIDPFLRGYASINGTTDQGFDVEEAALVTTALPYNLTVKGGRFFADFGRFPHWHDEALPFVDRPPSIDRLIGGESGSEGVEVSWLAPIEHYFEVTAGLYDTVGADHLEDLNENGFFGRRDFSELTVLAHPHTYFDLTDTLNLEVGGTWFGVPQDRERSLYGADVTLRHQPGTSGAYQGFVIGSEWYWGQQQLFEDVVLDDGTIVTLSHRPNRKGGYAYLEAFFARRYSAGARFDYSESPEDLVDLRHARDLARTGSAFVTWMPSEFQRLRFQFDTTWGDQPTNQRYTLQWTAFIGSHSHGFAQR